MPNEQDFLSGILDLTPTPSPVKDELPIPLMEKKLIPRPTRDEMLKVVFGLINGTVPSPIGPYKDLRETPGQSNRSPQLDKLITLQGGHLGDPYCQLGQQQVLDDICAYYGVKRKYVRLPEGSSTQTVFDLSKDYYCSFPAPLCWITWRVPGTYKGHTGMITSVVNKDKCQTMEFNTTIRSDEGVERDGEGFAEPIRRFESVGSMHLRGYVDVYEAVCDAIKMQNKE
jgi:hypothetical protein